MLGFGIANVPSIFPKPFVNIAPPKEKAVPLPPRLGVVNAFTSCLSKKAYILVNGFRPVALKKTFLARINGIRAVETNLSPSDRLSICAITCVFTPCLVLVPD